MSQRSNKTKICPVCGKEFHYLGYARHCAMHRDERKRKLLREEQL